MRKNIAPIPEPPRTADPALRAFLASMKEALEVRLGRRGDAMEEAVTKRDLVDAGIAVVKSPLLNTLGPSVVPQEGARVTPPVPLGVMAEGIFGGVSLAWENPFTAYNVHAYAEIWRGESNDRGVATLIDSSRGTTFFDRLTDTDDAEYWYWIRFVSEFGRLGPFSLPVVGRKAADVKELMDRISGQIDESDLAAGFADTLGELKNSYFVKLDVSGYASGFGMVNDGRQADFAVLADRFWVGSPQAGRTKPFMVVDGVTYIDTAMIREGTIQSGQIGAVTFGKVVDADGNPVTDARGLLRADLIEADAITVTDANISGVIKSTQVASNGQPRWMLDKNGGMTMNGSSTGGRMEMRESFIKVFDSNGVKRVQLGDLKA